MRLTTASLPARTDPLKQVQWLPAERNCRKMSSLTKRGVQAMWIAVLLLGLAVGVLVGLMGVGGGVIVVPGLVYLHGFLNLPGMDQHMAQGTSLFLQLPPVGLGALYLYWKRGHVNWRAGLACAVGFLAGGYFGSLMAIGIHSKHLQGLFGLFMMVAAALLWHRSGSRQAAASPGSSSGGRANG